MLKNYLFLNICHKLKLDKAVCSLLKSMTVYICKVLHKRFLNLKFLLFVYIFLTLEISDFE